MVGFTPALAATANRCHEFITAHSVHVKRVLLVFCFDGGCLFFANVLCIWELSLVFGFI